MRTPETVYFDHGYFKFKKLDGKIHYQIWKYVKNGLMSYIVDQGDLDNQEQLDNLLSLGNVKT